MYRARDPDRPRWWLALYQGFFTPKYFSELFTTRPELEDQWFRGAGLGRELLAWRDMGLEVEVVYADHYGSQDFQEGVAVLLARWHALWGEGWRLSGAVGEGVSYATEIPWFEAAEGKSTQWINYLAFELEAGHAAASPFSLVARIHHRSSVFKLIGNGEADSNYWTLGLRARF